MADSVVQLRLNLRDSAAFYFLSAISLRIEAPMPQDFAAGSKCGTRMRRTLISDSMDSCHRDMKEASSLPGAKQWTG